MRSADRGGLVRLRLEEGRAGMGRELREGGRGSLGFHRKSPRTIMVERLLSSPLSLLGALIASILCVKHNSDSVYHLSNTIRQEFKQLKIISF